MKWFWQRRKKDQPQMPTAEPAPASIAQPPERARATTAPLGFQTQTPALEPRSELLAFARDLLSAQGLRVRVEEDDLVTATTTDGATTRYTTTVARARAEEATTLLTQGAPSLSSFFDDAAERARVSSVTLTRPDDLEGATLRALQLPSEACGRCANNVAQDGPPHTPTCEACPLRHGGLAIRWESRPQTPRIVDWDMAHSVELTYRVSGRDRRGRREEWLRLAFDVSTSARIAPLTLAQLSGATPGAPQLDTDAIDTANTTANGALQPGMTALSAYLAQRVGAEYQQRIQDVTTTHERLKRERPDEANVIAATLDRELRSLADVYSVEVEAALDAVCHITTPLAHLIIPTADGGELRITVDAGRNAPQPLVCSACGKAMTAGRVCAQGHFICAECAEACAHCDTLRCPICHSQPFARCGLCHDWACDSCVRACDECGEHYCSDHVWACVAGDHTLCLNHVALCEECQAPLCQAHAAACLDCGKTLCPDHARVCVTGHDTLCSEHAAICVTCSQPLCANHTLRCDECGQALCEADRFACLGCGRSLCAACAQATACETCDATYCAHCHAGNATCPACRSLAPITDDDLQPLRLAAEHDKTINLKRTWQGGRNAQTRVYVSRGLGREEVYVVSEQGEVIASHRKGWRA